MAKSELDADLLAQAAELNIEVTDTATNEALKAAIDEVLAEDAGKTRDPLDHDGDGKKGGSKAAKKSGPKAYSYRVNRDFWTANPDDPDNPIRTRKGTIVEMTADEAQDGLESGAISRVKD